MFTTKQFIDTTPPPSTTNNISFISLPSELLCQIFSHFDHNLKLSSSSYFPSSTFTNQKINLKTLHSCCLVSRHWCINAIPFLYSNTFSHYQFINTKKLIETYLKCIKYNEDGNRGEDGDDISSSPSSLHDHSTSTPFNLSPSISQETPSTLFNYPSYLKHLDYYGLIVSIKRFLPSRSLYTFDQSLDITCNDGDLSIPRSPTSVNDKALVLELQQEKSKNYLIKRFLKLFYGNNSIITSLIIDTDDETTCSLSDEEYLLWYNNEDKNDRLLFKNLKNLIVKANFCQDNLFFKLKDVCKNLETLRINMSNFIAHNNNNNNKKKIESQNLAILISSQTNLKHFELYGFECFTELILPSLIYQSHSLQTLILEYLDFNDCNNDSLTGILSCRKLQVLKFIGCTNLKKETFKCLEKSATNTSNSGDYWSELKDVCVTPNMCEEMRNWAKRIKNNNNNSNCNISRNNRSINRIIELSQKTNLIKSVK